MEDPMRENPDKQSISVNTSLTIVHSGTRLHTAKQISTVVSQNMSWLLALNASQNYPKLPAPQIACGEEVLSTDFSWLTCL